MLNKPSSNLKCRIQGTSLVAQWLRLCASNAGSTGSNLGWGTKNPCAMWHSYKVKINKMQFPGRETRTAGEGD